MKKAILAGVGALFMTEEGARRLAREWKLPKEVIGFIGQQAHAAKDEVLRVLSDEIRRFLRVGGGARRALEGPRVDGRRGARRDPAPAATRTGPRGPEVKATGPSRRRQPRKGRR